MDVFSKQKRNPQLRNTIKTKVKMLPFFSVMIATKMFDRTLNDKFWTCFNKINKTRLNFSKLTRTVYSIHHSVK